LLDNGSEASDTVGAATRAARRGRKNIRAVDVYHALPQLTHSRTNVIQVA
jgi:hypothetical protein